MPFPAPRRIAPFALVALLAACGGQGETPAADETTDTAVADAAPAAAATPIAYDCLPAQRLTASYDNSGETPTATLTLDGTTYELTGEQAASGARYVTQSGRSPGRTLVWWTQGPDGTLYEGTVGGTAADEQKLADCSPSASAG